MIGPNDDELRRQTEQHEERSRTQFVRDLTVLINRYSRENGSDTPDFILAEYLMRCLDTWNAATVQRDKWNGNTREQRESVI